MQASAKLLYRLGMRRNPHGVRRTPTQWQDLITTWTESGEPAADFAHRHGCSPASLYRWRNRLGLPEGVEEPPCDLRLVPVVVDEAEDLGATEWRIQTSQGLSIAMSGPGAGAGLSMALRVLLDHEVL